MSVDVQLYLQVFDSREGRAVLEDLRARHVGRAVTAGGIDAVLQTYYEAGQREVIRLIDAKIRQARETKGTDE